MAIQFFDAFTRFGSKPRQHAAQRWTIQHLVDEMRFCSISGALVIHTAQTLYDTMLENTRLIDRIKGHDFLFPIWNALPHWTGVFPEPADLIERMKKNNVRAVALHPRTNGWVLRSPTSRPLLDALEKERVFTLIDMGAECNAEELEPILERHPNLPIMGRGMFWSTANAIIPLLRKFKNFHIGFDTFQVSYGPEWLCGLGLEDQLVFCSNAVDMSMGAHRMYIDYADVSALAKAKIAGGNLTRLLKGAKPPREIVNKDEDFVMAEAREGKPLSPLVLDIHAHMLDEGSHSAGASYAMWHGGPTGVRKLAQRMGVKGIGIMSWNGPVSVQAEEGNQCVRDAMTAYPDFYWGLATFDVMHCTPEQMKAQIEETFKDKRFLGLKPYPQYGVPYSDKRFDVWWEYGNAHHLYCGIHPVNWFQAGEFDSLCSRFPNLTVVGYHCGGAWDIADTCIGLAKKYANFNMEITLTPVWGGIIEYLVNNTSSDRVLYGSDLPMRDPRQQLGWVVYSRLPIEDKLKVLGTNTKRIIDNVRAHQS